MGAKSYRIDDEPQPGRLAQLAVDPLWPLLGLMPGGVWLSWPWFLVNGYAVGSPTREREFACVMGGLVGATLITTVILYLLGIEVIDQRGVKYALLILIVWKIGVSYVLYSLQSRTIQIYEYYGGVLRNGLVVLVVGAFFIRRPVMDAVAHPFLVLLLR